jgi:hypothetical protein
MSNETNSILIAIGLIIAVIIILLLFYAVVAVAEARSVISDLEPSIRDATKKFIAVEPTVKTALTNFNNIYPSLPGAISSIENLDMNVSMFVDNFCNEQSLTDLGTGICCVNFATLGQESRAGLYKFLVDLCGTRVDPTKFTCCTSSCCSSFDGCSTSDCPAAVTSNANLTGVQNCNTQQILQFYNNNKIQSNNNGISFD